MSVNRVTNVFSSISSNYSSFHIVKAAGVVFRLLGLEYSDGLR
jgi:hypothetical protein